MQPGPRDTITPFVFSDPAGKRWPRLRLSLLISAIVVFIATVLFVQTLFVAPQLQLPFSLRQLKGQLKSLQKKNPAGQAPAEKPLWEKFGLARHAAKKPVAQPSPPAHPRKKSPGQRSAARFLHQRRSLQLRVARATRRANHACLSGMDGRCRWARRLCKSTPTIDCQNSRRAKVSP